ncbi:MAG: hypothetical protein H6817_03880 [Phycisphaerales bacterium]|nr:hypothetical protein [Phycisphaerales bacterium]
MNKRHVCTATALVATLALLLAATPGMALTLVGTTAGVMDSSHPQVGTVGGNQAHLLRVVTPADMLDAAVDADVLLADGTPLVTTWRRDAGDTDVLDLALAMVIDSAPCHVELRLRSDDGAPAFVAAGDLSTNAVPVVVAPRLVVVKFAEHVGALTDVLLGAVDTSITFAPPNPWRIDVSQIAIGDTFKLILRAGPQGDFDDDDDVDATDYQQLHACLDSGNLSTECAGYFDFDADEHIDLQDFAIFQALFTGDDVPADCGA